MDECHHAAASSFAQVLTEVRARYVTGLTATPKRRDGQHPIFEMQLDPARYVVDRRSSSATSPFARRLVVRETEVELTGETDLPIQRIYRSLAGDERRNDLILNDVIGALDAGPSPLVLTERKDHLDFLAGRLRAFTRHLIVLQGGVGAKKRREALAALAAIPDGEEFLVLATGRYIGEGFDDARLDTLFLTMPVSGHRRAIHRSAASIASGEDRGADLRLCGPAGSCPGEDVRTQVDRLSNHWL